MSLGINLLLILFVFCINIVITIILIQKNTLSHKLLKELKSEVKNIINEVDNHIVLAENTKNELSLLLKKANVNIKRSGVSKSKHKVHSIPDSKLVSKDSGTIGAVEHSRNNFEENIVLINMLLLQGASSESIMDILHLTLEEINLVKMLQKQNKK